MSLNRKTRRWLKKLGNIVIGTLIVAITIIGSNFYNELKNRVTIETPRNNVVEIQKTYNLDKINDVLKKNNLEVLSIDFSGDYSKTIVDEPKFKIFGDTFTEFRKKVANKTLNLTADFNAIYKYDLSKLEATRVGDVTLIQLSEDDLELTIQYHNN